MIPILVIDSDKEEVYKFCREIWRINCSKHKDEFKLVFLKSTPELKNHEFQLIGDTLFTAYHGLTNHEIINKTIIGFEFSLTNFCFSHLLRTNLSSFFALSKILSLIPRLPHEKCYAGFLGKYSEDPANNGDEVSFVSGAGLFLSRDVVNLVVDRKNNIPYLNDLDDIWISKILHDVPQKELRRFDFTQLFSINQVTQVFQKIQESDLLLDHYHFRVKCSDASKRKFIDPLVLSYLLSLH